MTRRDAELQSDTQRPRQRYPPWEASGGGGGKEGRSAQEIDLWVWPLSS